MNERRKRIDKLAGLCLGGYVYTCALCKQKLVDPHPQLTTINKQDALICMKCAKQKRYSKVLPKYGLSILRPKKDIIELLRNDKIWLTINNTTSFLTFYDGAQYYGVSLDNIVSKLSVKKIWLGKHKGKLFDQLPIDYLGWIIKQDPSSWDFYILQFRARKILVDKPQVVV